MSSDTNTAPKRRSSAANRRRRGQAAQRAQVVEQQESVAAEPVSTTSTASEPRVERHVQRREERRAAKTRQPERGNVVDRVVSTERFSGTRRFIDETMSEIRKVQWPDRETTLHLTILVIALSLVLGILLGTIDFALLRLFEQIA